MKFKTSKKNIKNNYYQIIGIGYCQAQYLLHYEDPIAYSAGIYGWSCDYYKINSNAIISTGYNSINGLKYKYELLDEYNKKAEKIVCNNSLEWEDKKHQVKHLLAEFVQLVLNPE